MQLKVISLYQIPLLHSFKSMDFDKAFSDINEKRYKLRSTGYNQSVTGCGSQRRHVVVTQRKLM